MCACATVTRGTKEVMVIESTPSGALVSLSNDKMSGAMTCTTPCTVEMPRKRGFEVTVEKEGYETIQTKVITQVAGGGAAGMAGNVLVGGVIGAGVDVASGAMNEFKPNPLVLTLVPLAVAPQAENDVQDATVPKADEEAELGS